MSTSVEERLDWADLRITEAAVVRNCPVVTLPA